MKETLFQFRNKKLSMIVEVMTVHLAVVPIKVLFVGRPRRPPHPPPTAGIPNNQHAGRLTTFSCEESGWLALPLQSRLEK